MTDFYAQNTVFSQKGDILDTIRYRKEAVYMYENENYAGNSSGNIDNNASPYFDYTTHVTTEPAPDSDKMKKRKDVKEKKERQQKEQGAGTLRKLALCVCMGLCFGAFAALGFYAVQLGTGQIAQREESTEREEKDKGDKESEDFTVQTNSRSHENTGAGVWRTTYVQPDFSEMVENVMPAMVSIVNNYSSVGWDFWGRYVGPGAASGSGIIVGETDSELLIATNNHVVKDAAKLEITFIDGNKAEAVIKGTDADMDLAVVAVSVSNLSEDTRKAITVARLGDSDNLRLGEPVIAIGNALGYGQSVTDGIVSALNREVEGENGSKGVFIQTNAAINPGNSGGALLNVDGEVIGINSSKIASRVGVVSIDGENYAVEGMGYAIPISAASPILAELMERETRTAKVDADEMGYMGVGGLQTISKEIAQAYGWPQGVSVREVVEGSAAEAAGILKGDIIVKFDGQKIYLATDLQNILQYYRVGEKTVVTVMRLVDGEYESIDLEITLGTRPRE